MRLPLALLHEQTAELVRGIEAEAGRDAHMVTYAHEIGGILYHGTISSLQEEVLATWSYDDGDTRVTRNRPYDHATFEELWRDIGRLAVFRGAGTVDPQTVIDLSSQHVVTLAEWSSGEVRWSIQLVPETEHSPDFAAWLQKLRRPDQPPSQLEVAAAEGWLQERITELTRHVLADLRWNEEHVFVFAMLLYGFALEAADHMMFVERRSVDAFVSQELTGRLGVTLDDCGGFMDNARWSAFDPGYHPTLHQLVVTGRRYFSVEGSPHWTVIVDDVFGRIREVRLPDEDSEFDAP
jgi:hypothetical protein